MNLTKNILCWIAALSIAAIGATNKIANPDVVNADNASAANTRWLSLAQTNAPIMVLQPVTTLTVGGISICTTNGKVTIPEGMSLDEASSNFWVAVSQAFPEMFVNVDRK